MKPEEKVIGLADAAVADRRTLLNGLNDIMEIAKTDYGITRTALIKMHEKMSEILNNLKCEKLIEQYTEGTNV